MPTALPRAAFLWSVPLLLLSSHQASAGGADGCTPVYSLDHTHYLCGAYGQPFLAPGNDSRINLSLLILDQRGIPPIPSGTNGLPVADFVPPLLYFTEYETPYHVIQASQEQELTRLGTAASRASISGVYQTDVFKRLRGWLYGRCAYNNARAAADFVEAVNDADMLDAETRRTLARTRLDRVGRCDDELAMPAEFDGQTEGADFHHYLTGIAHFYRGGFTLSADQFAALTTSEIPWVAEAALYMQARAALNLAQQDALGGWTFEHDKVDLAELARSERLFRDYLEHYPQGHYADSAAGLFRRIYWLGGDRVRLGEAYAEVLGEVEVSHLAALIGETDLYYLRPSSSLDPMAHPMFALARQLQDIRDPSYAVQPRPAISAASLRDTYSGFGKDADVWANLAALAWRLYRDRDYSYVIENTAPAESGPLDLARFSAQMYRGIAFHRSGRWQDAEAHWRRLATLTDHPAQTQTVHLALAISLERGGRLAVLFAEDSPVRDQVFRLPIIAHVAPADVLRQVVLHSPHPEERQEALHRLLRGRLSRGQYADFLEERALAGNVPSDIFSFRPLLDAASGFTPELSYDCPPTRELAERLMDNSAQAPLLNCLGDILAATAGSIHLEPYKPMHNEPGGGPDQFGGKTRTAMSLYRQVIEQESPPSEHHAYALYRAINCYLRGHNRCGDERIDQSERQRWFSQLKNRHADTVWARHQKYYW